MGLLLQNISKLRGKLETANGVINFTSMSEWFGNQKAIKRECALEEVNFEPKSAVVIVGVSGIGKSTFAEKFLKFHPEFELCSFDEFYYQAQYQDGISEKAAKMVANQLFEKKLRNAARHSRSLILEGVYINIAFRAAVFQTLQTFGYKIHVVYFPLKYANEKIAECSLRRAVELYLYKEYIDTELQNRTIKGAIEIRKKIMTIYSEKLGKSVSELYESYAENPKVVESAKSLVEIMKNEAKRNLVENQEKNGTFLCGAHYYYEIQG